MADEIEVRELTAGDVEAASRLVIEAFQRAIAPLYSEQGVQEFLSYAAPKAIAERVGQDHLGLAAWSGTQLAGVAEVRGGNHLAMLFVAPGMQRGGVGRRLLERVVEACLERDPSLEALTVHSSPNSVTAYEKFGFIATGPEQDVNGIRFTPMSLPLAGRSES